MANFVSYSDMTTLMTAIGNKFAALNGAYVIKGNSTFANLPATPTVAQTGFVYNVTDEFTTDSRFVEGSGKKYPADTNVVIVNLGDASVPNMKYDVIGAFVDVGAIDEALNNLQISIADAFEDTEAYSEGDIVTYGRKLYAFNTDHAAGDWDDTEVDEITVEELIAAVDAKADGALGKIAIVESSIADAFSTSEAYTTGDVVVYDSQLYKFKADKSAGAWDDSKVDAITVEDLIDAAGGDVSALTTRVETFETAIAPAFDPTESYSAGDRVIYGDELYKFDSAHSAGAWTGSDATKIDVSDELDAAADATSAVNTRVNTVVGELAPAFSAATNYSIGDVVVKDDVLYKFNAAHSAGAWIDTDVDAIKVSDLEPESLTSAQITALEALL